MKPKSKHQELRELFTCLGYFVGDDGRYLMGYAHRTEDGFVVATDGSSAIRIELSEDGRQLVGAGFYRPKLCLALLKAHEPIRTEQPEGHFPPVAQVMPKPGPGDGSSVRIDSSRLIQVLKGIEALQKGLGIGATEFVLNGERGAIRLEPRVSSSLVSSVEVAFMPLAK